MEFQSHKILFGIKRLWRPFLLVFLSFFLIFNWEKISWVFNYKAISIFFSHLFSQPQITQREIKEERPEIKKEAKEIFEKFEYSEKENSLEIPRIEISAPIFLVESTQEKKILESLDRGLVLFSDFSLPGQPGKTLILGHSARHDWPKTIPGWVFTYLRDVVEGDEIILHFNHRKYLYSVTKKITLKEGEEISHLPLTDNENLLLLITCWPPGKLSAKQRLAVEARLKTE